jgi:hypothetical protein
MPEEKFLGVQTAPAKANARDGDEEGNQHPPQITLPARCLVPFGAVATAPVRCASGTPVRVMAPCCTMPA